MGRGEACEIEPEPRRARGMRRPVVFLWPVAGALQPDDDAPGLRDANGKKADRVRRPIGAAIALEPPDLPEEDRPVDERQLVQNVENPGAGQHGREYAPGWRGVGWIRSVRRFTVACLPPRRLGTTVSISLRISKATGPEMDPGSGPGRRRIVGCMIAEDTCEGRNP